MVEDIRFDPNDRFIINPLFMFRWEETQDAYVLLYPEGVVKLNETAGEILKRCIEDKCVAEIVDEMSELFAAPGLGSPKSVKNGVFKFLEVSQEKGWIKRKV